MVFQLILGHRFYLLSSKQGPNLNLAPSRLFQYYSISFFCLEKPSDLSPTSPSNRDNSQITSAFAEHVRLRWPWNIAGLRFHTLTYTTQNHQPFPSCQTPQPRPVMTIGDFWDPISLLMQRCHIRRQATQQHAVVLGLSGEVHEIPPPSAYPRFFLPAQQTWQWHLNFCWSGLWKPHVLISEQVSEDFWGGCERGSHGRAIPWPAAERAPSGWKCSAVLAGQRGLKQCGWFSETIKTD